MPKLKKTASFQMIKELMEAISFQCNPANSMVSNNLRSGDGFSDFLILFTIVFKSVVYRLSLEKCICFHVLKSKKNMQRANKNS